MIRILAALIAAAFAFTAAPAFSQSTADKAESGAKKTQKKAKKSAKKAKSKTQKEAGRVEGRAELKKADSK
jgi:Ni/Co efflux regulator RcnB